MFLQNIWGLNSADPERGGVIQAAHHCVEFYSHHCTIVYNLPLHIIHCKGVVVCLFFLPLGFSFKQGFAVSVISVHTRVGCVGSDEAVYHLYTCTHKAQC